MLRLFMLPAAIVAMSAACGFAQDFDSVVSAEAGGSGIHLTGHCACSTGCDFSCDRTCTCDACACGVLNSRHGDFLTREHLTDGFWGLQPALAEHGILYDAELTQFYQGVANGGFEQTFKYGGKLDQFFIFEGEKLGLWNGFEIVMHAESRFGEDVIGAATNLAPVNINMLYPTLENETAISGLQFMQALSPDWAITVGRINTLDLIQSIYPQTGRGIDGFMNTSTFLPMTVGNTIPLVFNGAGLLKMNEKRIQGGVLALDPRNIPTESGLDDLFSNGVSLVGLWRSFHEVGGLPGSNLFLGSWAGGDFIAFDHPWIIEPDIPAVIPAEVQGTWSVAYVLEQQLWADQCDRNRNIGLLSEWGYADPATNLYEWVANVSVQANGLVPGRDADRMGVGWFYNGISSDLKDLASPLLEVQDLTGVEVYYSAAITPWFHLTTDLQVVEPSFREFGSTAFVFGMRAKISL